MNYATKLTPIRGCGFRSPGGLYMVADSPALPCGLLPFRLDRCPTCNGGIKQTRSFQWINPQPFVTAWFAARTTDGYTPEEAMAESTTCGGGACLECWKLWGERCGLLWIGACYYDTPVDWLKETADMGVSRRISAVPTDFEIGTHWVLAGHPKAIRVLCKDCGGTGGAATPALLFDPRSRQLGPRCDTCSGSGAIDARPGIFSAFKPSAIEYVLKDNEKALLDERAKMGREDDEEVTKTWLGALELTGSLKTWRRLMRMAKRGVTLVHDLHPVQDR